MRINLNGEEVFLEKEVTVNELLEGQEDREFLAVQINNEFVSKELFDTLLIKENDTVEFLFFLGGG